MASSGHDGVLGVERQAGMWPACVEEGASVLVVLKGEPFTARVKRPLHRKEEGEEEVLRVRLSLVRHQFYHMNVFINMPSASAATPIASCPEFATAFNHTPLLSTSPEEKADHGLLHTTLFCVGIGDIVSQLGLSLHPHLLLTFVPTGRFKDAPVTIHDITIALE